MDAYGIFFVLENRRYEDNEFKNQKSIVIINSDTNTAFEMECKYYQAIPENSYIFTVGRILRDSDDNPYFSAQMVELLPLKDEHEVKCQLFISVHAAVTNTNGIVSCIYSPYDSVRKCVYGSWHVKITYPSRFTPPRDQTLVSVSGKVIDIDLSLVFTIEMTKSEFCPRATPSHPITPPKNLKRVNLQTSQRNQEHSLLFDSQYQGPSKRYKSISESV